MSTIKDFLCLLIVVICYGIAGRIDYDDALLLDEAQRHPAIAVDIGCPTAIPAVSESNERELVDSGDASTSADPCVIE
jgi:hypothetical protein